MLSKSSGKSLKSAMKSLHDPSGNYLLLLGVEDALYIFFSLYNLGSGIFCQRLLCRIAVVHPFIRSFIIASVGWYGCGYAGVCTGNAREKEEEKAKGG